MGDKPSANERWNCRRKITYRSRKEGKKAVRELRDKGYALIEYRCKVCGEFHVCKKSNSRRHRGVVEPPAASE